MPGQDKDGVILKISITIARSGQRQSHRVRYQSLMPGQDIDRVDEKDINHKCQVRTKIISITNARSGQRKYQSQMAGQDKENIDHKCQVRTKMESS